MTIYPYIVVLRYTDRKTQATEEHTIAVEAYTLSDAMMQASIELDAKHDFTKNGYEVRLLSVGPDTSAMKERAASLVSELSDFAKTFK